MSDLTKLSTEDLLALKSGDLTKVSTEGLQALRTAQVAQQIDNDPISRGARNFTDDMGALDKLNAGTVSAFANIGRGLRQRLGLMSRDEVAADRAIDAPLMRTGAGLTGNLLGNLMLLAPASLVPGAQAVPAAATIGAITGYLQPSTSAKDDVTNTVLGAAGGAAGQWLANKAAGSVAFQQAEAAKTVARNAQKTATARAASKEGYVVPPEDLGEGGGAITRALSGFGGKIKTAQEASQANQTVTDTMARRALGLGPSDELTIEALQKLRNQAATQGYAPVRSSGTVVADAAFDQALTDIASKYKTVSQSFPGLGPTNMHGRPIDEIADLVSALKQPRFDAGDAVDAVAILRESADKAFRSGDKTVGKASRAAADALENLLDRHLQAAGNPEAINAFREARKLIAKTYTVQKGLNPQTGSVSAQKLANELAKGKPLSGELRTIAETASAFPKATQMLKEAPKALSPLDMAVAGGGALSGNPLMMAWLARPVVRRALLSAPMQEAAMRAAETPTNANALLRVLENENLMMPAGVIAGTALARAYQ